jgi:hypothetical protein
MREGFSLQEDRTIVFGQDARRAIYQSNVEFINKVNETSKDTQRASEKNFTDIYPEQEINADMKLVSTLEKKFDQDLDHLTLDEQRRISETKERADALETTIVNLGELSNWFGENAKVFRTTKFDDIINGVDLKLKFPESYHVADLAGADVVFETKINTVNEKVLPKLDDEFAAKTGNPEITTLKDLKADIKRELLAQKEREASEKRKDALVGILVEKSKVPVPDVLVEDQMRSIEQDMMQNLMYQNITMDNYLSAQGFKDKEEWTEKELKPAATKRVQAGLVLSELSKELGVVASPEEIEEHINRYKQSYANNPEMLKRFDEPEVKRDITNRLLTEKTVDELVALNG